MVRRGGVESATLHMACALHTMQTTMQQATPAVAAPQWAGAPGCAQLVSLRAFQPHFRSEGGSGHTGRRPRRCCTAAAASSTAADLLQGAQALVLPPTALDVDQHDQLPPYEEWQHHPELLQGRAPLAAAACRCRRSRNLSSALHGFSLCSPAPPPPACPAGANRAPRPCAWPCSSAVAWTAAWRCTCCRRRATTSRPFTYRCGAPAPGGQLGSGCHSHWAPSAGASTPRLSAASPHSRADLVPGGLPQLLGRVPLGGGPGLLPGRVRAPGGAPLPPLLPLQISLARQPPPSQAVCGPPDSAAAAAFSPPMLPTPCRRWSCGWCR